MCNILHFAKKSFIYFTLQESILIKQSTNIYINDVYNKGRNYTFKICCIPCNLRNLQHV